MDINAHLDKLNVQGKKHLLLLVTPKDMYPNNFIDEKYLKMEQSILIDPKSYISVYNDDPNEIMKYVAFRLFIKPIICDVYSLRHRETTKVKRLSEKEVVSYFVIQHFYDTIPSGEKKEDRAIIDGKLLGKEFLEKHPFKNYEYAFAVVGKDSDESNILMNLYFHQTNDNYYFDRVYAH